MLWLCVSRCRCVSWLLLSFDRWKSFHMWFSGDMSMGLTCISMFVGLPPGAGLPKSCSHGLELLGVCKVCSFGEC